MQKNNKKVLGRGLNALMNSHAEEKEDEFVVEIDITKIEPNPNQPRKNFEKESIVELAESIRNFGILQPLIVKKDGDFYTIIAGERRYRAAKHLKLREVPVIIKEYDEVETVQVALIENLQREDLNPIEEAQCYKKLSEEFLYSQEDIAKKLGKKRSTISQYMNLLALDTRVQQFLADGKMSVGQGKVLLNTKDNDEQFKYAEHCLENHLNIKQLENFILQEEKKSAELATENNAAIVATNRSEKIRVSYKTVEHELRLALGTKVNIKNGKNKGRIEIEYYNAEELDRLIVMLKN